MRRGLLAAGVAGAVWAGGAFAADLSAVPSVRFHGFVSAAYDYNFNTPHGGMNGFRVFDEQANSFSLDVVEVVVERASEAGSPAGFRVDLTAGSAIPHVTAARGLFRDRAGVGADVDLQQAFVTLAPGSGPHFDVGKFVTPFGYEVIEGYDGFNDQATRSLLFGYAIPFTHTGVRAGYSVSPRVAATALLVNGWDNVVDNNAGKSVGGQVAWTPCGSVSVLAGGMLGPEQDGDTQTRRRLFDAVAVWHATSAVTVGGNYDWGRDRREPPPGTEGPILDVRWTGGAGYVRVESPGGVAVSVRGEWFRDASGVRTGVAQTLREVTVTPEWAVAPSVRLRADVRRDWSTVAAFFKDAGTSDRQVTVRGNVVVGF